MSGEGSGRCQEWCWVLLLNWIVCFLSPGRIPVREMLYQCSRFKDRETRDQRVCLPQPQWLVGGPTGLPPDFLGHASSRSQYQVIVLGGWSCRVTFLLKKSNQSSCLQDHFMWPLSSWPVLPPFPSHLPQTPTSTAFSTSQGWQCPKQAMPFSRPFLLPETFSHLA